MINPRFCIFLKELIDNFKILLRQLEELHIEALILNDLEQEQTEEEEEQLENINLNTSKNLIKKWNYLANLSEFDELKQLIIKEDEKNNILNTAISSSTSFTYIEHHTQMLVDNKNEELDNTAAAATTTPTTSPKKSKIDLMSSSIIELKNTVETEKTLLQSDIINNTCNPNIFINCLEKLHNSLEIVDKHLENIQKLNKEFYDFEKQNLKLNSIKDALESLSTALKTSLKHKKVICEKANKDLNKKITKLLNQLTKEHQLVVKKYKEKDAIYTKNFDLWREFHKDYDKINEWLSVTLARLNEIKQTIEYERVEEMIKDFSNLTSYRLLLERTNLNGHEIVRKSNDNDSKILNDSLTNLNKNWKNLISDLNELKDKQKNKSIEIQQQPIVRSKSEATIFEQFNIVLNEINKWILNGQSLSKKSVSPVDELENERLLLELRVCCCFFKII
jgi:hypothetical protein